MRIKLFNLVMVLVFFMLFCGVAFAGPFLTCDPYDKQGDDTDPTHFLLQFDGGGWIQSPVVEKDNKFYLEYDLSGLPDGEHTVKAKVVNVWGESDESDPFVFTKERLPAPTNIRFDTR